MEEGLRFSFDKEADILDISIGKPKKSISKEVEDDFFVRCDPKTDKIIGSSKIRDFRVCSEIRDF